MYLRHSHFSTHFVYMFILDCPICWLWNMVGCLVVLILLTSHMGWIITQAIDAFLEELIIRRELADNFCYYQPQYDSLQGAWEWARKTLMDHAADKREHLYTSVCWSDVMFFLSPSQVKVCSSYTNSSMSSLMCRKEDLEKAKTADCVSLWSLPSYR